MSWDDPLDFKKEGIVLDYKTAGVDIDDQEFKEVDFSAIGRCIVEKADDELNDEDANYFVI